MAGQSGLSGVNRYYLGASEALGVAGDVDSNDPAIAHRELDKAAGPPARRAHQAGHAIDKRERGEPGAAAQHLGNSGRSTRLAERAHADGGDVGSQHDVGVEQAHQRVESLAFTPRSPEKLLDDLPMTD